jgi:serine/threonine protein kinase
MPVLSEPERERRLDAVLASYLQALKEGSAPGRKELLDSHPDLADDLAAFFADQDHFDQLAAPLRGLAPASARLAAVRDFGDYEIQEEIARGGMGVVYKARQKSLGRVVALKMLLAGPWASADDLQRFRTEAESAAQLDHPNIVPIHDVGTHDGHPYLCMKFVEGGSLARRLLTAECRPSDREAAALLATIADAIHYAHQRGILHRDLKPANVLLQKAVTTNHTNHTNKKNTKEKDNNPKKDHAAAVGSMPADLPSSDSCDSWSNFLPIITDFGLAKRGALTRAAMSAAQTVILPAPRTQTGAIVGTPGYMAPEQASGSPAAVTTAADVYGLGAILYEMLTGRPPFRGLNPLDTIRQVLDNEPARPSTLNPRIHRDLETICLKCLHKQPSRRYASARELADDLRRFLDGEPILARPVGPLERTWRLARRQPLVAGLTLALVVVLLGAVTGVTALWLHAEANAQSADEHRQLAEQQRDHARTGWLQADKNRQEAEQHLEDAERSFRMAHQAVHDYCRRVSDELRDAPNLQPLRKALLEDALRYYQSFLARRGQDAGLRAELADTYRSMAFVTASIGSRGDARAAHERALALYRELQQADPDNVELQRKLAGTLNSIATLIDTSEEVLAQLRKAHDAYTRFLEKHPDDRQLRAGLGITLNNLGAVCSRTGRPEGRNWFDKARTLQERLLDEAPSDLNARANLANTLSNYAVLRGQEEGGRDGALRALERARDLRRELTKARPRDVRNQADLAASYFALGIAQRDAGRLDEAEKTLTQAHTMRDKIARDNPFVSRYQIDLAASYINLGVLYGRQNHKEQALKYYEKARDIQERLVRLDPGTSSYRRELALSYYNIGTLHGALKRRNEERQAFLKARDLQEALVKADPDNLDHRIDLGRILNNLAWNRMALNHPEEAPPLAREAVGHLRFALDRAPRVITYRQLLNNNYGTLGEAEVRLGHTRAAAQAMSEREKLWPDNPAELYRIARELAIVAGRVGGGKPELTPAEKTERQQEFDHALAVLRKAVAAGFKDADRLQKDKAFDPLRSNDAFRDLTREVEKQAAALKK